MGYVKAEGILPAELLAAVQEHIDGAYIYIPRLSANKKTWGESTNSKAQLAARNSEITRRYREGTQVNELAAMYCLSDKTIYKVLSGCKNN